MFAVPFLPVVVCWCVCVCLCVMVLCLSCCLLEGSNFTSAADLKYTKDTCTGMLYVVQQFTPHLCPASTNGGSSSSDLLPTMSWFVAFSRNVLVFDCCCCVGYQTRPRALLCSSSFCLEHSVHTYMHVFCPGSMRFRVHVQLCWCSPFGSFVAVGRMANRIRAWK